MLKNKPELTEEQRSNIALHVEKQVKVVCEIALERGKRQGIASLSEPMAYEVIDLIEYTTDLECQRLVAKRVLEQLDLPLGAKKAVRKYFSIYT